MKVTNWRKSSRITEGGVAVRDTKQLGEGPVLAFSREEWAGFLRTVKGAE